MSWFVYGDTRIKKGVWLRYGSNEDIQYLVKKSRLKRPSETVRRVVVSEVNKKEGKVWLEVWCVSSLDIIRRKHRYNVFYIYVKENPEWICEGDLGRGYTEGKDR